VRPMTCGEFDTFCKQVADREELLLIRVRAYVDWLVTTPGPVTPEQADWLETAAYEGLISDKQIAALAKWVRRHARAQRKTQTLGEVAAAAVRRSWY
jgi:hypothetical protein